MRRQASLSNIGGAMEEESRQARMNAVRDTSNAARNPKLQLIVACIWDIPQLIAATWVLLASAGPQADAGCSKNFRLWSSLYVVNLAVYLLICVLSYRTERRLPPTMSDEEREAHPDVRFNAKLLSWSNLFSFVWFIVGNVWIIGDASCPDSSAYKLSFWLLVLMYVTIFSPCILLCTLIPLVFLCLPCLVRILSRTMDPMRGKGAKKDDVESLPKITYRTGMFGGGEITCPIALTPFEDGDQVVELRCGHRFHDDSISEWLLINANCPVCRTQIFATRAHPDLDDNNESSYQSRDGYGAPSNV